MTKILYNNEYIELPDKLEKGYMELDVITETKENLDNTLELKKINVEDTMEMKKIELVDTLEFEIGDNHE